MEVREAEAATVEGLNLPLAKILRQEKQPRRRDGRTELRLRVEWWLDGVVCVGLGVVILRPD